MIKKMIKLMIYRVFKMLNVLFFLNKGKKIFKFFLNVYIIFYFKLIFLIRFKKILFLI